MATPKKKTTKKQASVTNEIPISKAEKINIDRLFEQALVRHKKEEADKKSKLKEISHLALMAEEYLSCFALIGYSLQNEEVVVFNMSTAKDEAALVDLLRSTFIDIASNRP
jgi:hypothetical protein